MTARRGKRGPRGRCEQTGARAAQRSAHLARPSGTSSRPERPQGAPAQADLAAALRLADVRLSGLLPARDQPRNVPSPSQSPTSGCCFRKSKPCQTPTPFFGCCATSTLTRPLSQRPCSGAGEGADNVSPGSTISTVRKASGLPLRACLLPSTGMPCRGISCAWRMSSIHWRASRDRYGSCIRNLACAAPSPSSEIPVLFPGSIVRGCAGSSPNPFDCNSSDQPQVTPRTTSRHALHGPHTTPAAKTRASGKRVRFGSVMGQGCEPRCQIDAV